MTNISFSFYFVSDDSNINITMVQIESRSEFRVRGPSAIIKKMNLYFSVLGGCNSERR